jgi:hypothetical protein
MPYPKPETPVTESTQHDLLFVLLERRKLSEQQDVVHQQNGEQWYQE